MQEQQQTRLRNHIERVEVVCREQAFRRRESSENLRQRIGEKLEDASKRRGQSLQKKQQVAHLAAQRKHHADQASSSEATASTVATQAQQYSSSSIEENKTEDVHMSEPK